MKTLLIAIVLATVTQVLLVLNRPGFAASPAGKVLSFLAFLVLPVLALTFGGLTHLEQSKRTEFCLSCHEMQAYGASLYIDDSDFLPAAHFQNKRVDPDLACFSCHTDYTMYGDLNAKLKGVKHLWVHYLGTIPEELALYSPYNNRECLHCHGGARSFEESDLHVDMLEELRSNETSCLECHDLVHEKGKVEGFEMWKAGGAP